jgi:hypothetical protein
LKNIEKLGDHRCDSAEMSWSFDSLGGLIHAFDIHPRPMVGNIDLIGAGSKNSIATFFLQEREISFEISANETWEKSGGASLMSMFLT